MISTENNKHLHPNLLVYPGSRGSPFPSSGALIVCIHQWSCLPSKDNWGLHVDVRPPAPPWWCFVSWDRDLSLGWWILSGASAFTNRDLVYITCSLVLESQSVQYVNLPSHCGRAVCLTEHAPGRKELGIASQDFDRSPPPQSHQEPCAKSPTLENNGSEEKGKSDTKQSTSWAPSQPILVKQSNPRLIEF